MESIRDLLFHHQPIPEILPRHPNAISPFVSKNESGMHLRVVTHATTNKPVLMQFR
jgi:hypothetical protein